MVKKVIAAVGIAGGATALGAYWWLTRRIPPGKGTLEVTILYSSTGEAIEGATVTVNTTPETTDADGKASFTLDEGTYPVIASMDGYESESATAEVQEGMKTTVTLRLRESGAPEEYYALMAKVTGRAKAGDYEVGGYPIDGATVELTGPQPGRKDTVNGVVSWASLRAGEYSVKVTHPLFDELTGSFTLDANKEVTFELSGGPIEPTLRKLYDAADGMFPITPVVPGKTKFQFPVQGFQLELLVEDGLDGAEWEKIYIFEAPFPLTIRSPVDPDIVHSYPTIPWGWPLRIHEVEGASDVFQISVKGSKKIDDTTITVWSHLACEILKGRPGVAYTLRVQVTHIGRPIAGALVACNGGQCTTDSLGFCTITGISIGTSTINVSADGYESQSRTVELRSGENFQGFSLVPIPPETATLEALVASLGEPVAGATVACDGKQCTTNALGICRITDLPIGTATITVSAITYESESLTRELRAGVNYQGFSLTPIPPPPPPPTKGHLEGYVSIPTKPSWALSVCVVQIAGKESLCTTEGYYRITDIPVGTYYASCMRTKCYPEIQAVTIVGGQTNTKNWTLTPYTIPYSWTCPICGETFKTGWEAKAHIEDHKGD